MHDDTATLEQMATALEDLDGIARTHSDEPRAAAPTSAAEGDEQANGIAASEQHSSDNDEEEQPEAKTGQSKKKSKAAAAEAEGAANGNGEKKKKKRKNERQQ